MREVPGQPPGPRAFKQTMEVSMAETTIAIEGMSCQHCVMAVKKALGGVPGILESNVQIGNASVKYDEAKTTKEDIEGTIEKAGYTVKK